MFIALLLISIAGHWQGKVQLKQEVSVAVDLAQNAKGVWIGSLSIPGSTIADVPLDEIAVTGTSIKFSASLPGKSTFEGTLSADATEIVGDASNKEGSVPFSLKRTGDANVKVPPASSAITKEFAGMWEATVANRTVKLKIEATPDGIATAILISQGQEIPLTTVTIKDKELQMEARAISGTFQGRLNTAGEIDGEWKEGGKTTPLAFKRP